MRDRRIKIRRGVISSAEVLVVSDSEIIVYGYKRLLLQWQYNVFAVNEEEAAVQAIGQGTTVRLVIVWIGKVKERDHHEEDVDAELDGDREEEFDGLWIAQRIRRRNKRVKLLLIGDKSLREQAHDLKAVFLANTHSIKRFKFVVRELMS